MGFDFGDVWNPIEQLKDIANNGAKAFGVGGGGGDAGTYANVRGPNGQIVQVPSTYGQLLSQQTGLPAPVSVSDAARQALLAQQGGIAGQFADQAQQGYNAYGQQAQGALAALQRQAAGQDSVSAEQLRQGLAQQLAQQRSLAAGASPRNAAMAARTAAIQMGRASTAMAGQQSLAGLQERQQANNAYGQLIGQLRGQDLSAATQSRQNALGGYGAGNTGAPQPSWIQQYGPAIAGGIAAAASDRRLKTDIRPGDAAANAMIEALQRRAAMPLVRPTMSDRALKTGIKPGDDQANAAISTLAKAGPQTYYYKDQALGAGPQLGVMAQDVQRVIPQAVITVPDGPYAGKLALDPGKLSGANTAMIAALGRRVAALEGDQTPPTPPFPSLSRGPAEQAYAESPEGKKRALMTITREYDPKGVAAQDALDNRRARMQELDLRSSGAYPGGRPLGDAAGTAAQNELDQRRAVMGALARSAQIAQAGQ